MYCHAISRHSIYTNIILIEILNFGSRDTRNYFIDYVTKLKLGLVMMNSKCKDLVCKSVFEQLINTKLT